MIVNNHKRIIYITVSLLLLTLLILFYIKFNNLKDDNKYCDSVNPYLAELVYGFITNEALTVNDMPLLKGKEKSQTIMLSSIASDGVLVVRFSGNACSLCIDFIVKMVKTQFPAYSSDERIVLVVTHLEERKKDNYFGKEVYITEDEALCLPFDQYDIPYFFFMDSTMQCKMFFVPDFSQPELTNYYLENVKSRLFH